MQTAHLPRASLRAALASIIKAVPRKDPMPILSTVLIEERDGAVTIRATDLDAEVSAIVDGATATAGFAACLPAHQLRDAEKNAPGAENAVVTVMGSGALVTFGALTLRMVSRDPQDFPRMHEPEEPVTFTIPRAALREALAATEFAISTEETRYYLNGVFMQPTPAHERTDSLRFVSTDGHRMAVHDSALEGVPQFDGVIIRRDTVALLLPLLKAKGAPATVSVRVARQRIEFTCGAVVVRAKPIDGSFPDYARCVPRADDENTRATFNRRAMIEAIKAVATIKGKRGSAVGLSFADGRAKLWASSEDGGAESSVPCEVSGTPLDIGFNGRYLLDIFGAMSGDVVTIEMHDSGAPARIEEPDGTLYVLMPMRVGHRPAKPASMAAPAPEADAAPAAPVVVEAPPVPAVTTAPAHAEPVTTPTPHAPPKAAPVPVPSAIVVPFPRAKAAPVPPAPARAGAAQFVRPAAAMPPSASGAAFGEGRRSIGAPTVRQAAPSLARPPADGVSCGAPPPTEATSHAVAPPTEATRRRALAARRTDDRTRSTFAPPRRVVRLGSGQVVKLGTHVAAWRRARAAPPDARFRGSPCGWAGADEDAAEILRQFRAGMDARINQHLPWFGRGRRWGPEWQAEASRLARAVNTPRLIVRWAPPEFRARLAHRIEDAA